MKLQSNNNFLISCYEKIKTNRGALTPGTDHKTVDEIAEIYIQNITDELRSGVFTFGKARRIYVEKPGKTKLRPITIPNIRDRIVQEEIRIILNVIYEPIFTEQNYNFGFRPGHSYSCNEAIGIIKQQGRQIYIAIVRRYRRCIR